MQYFSLWLFEKISDFFINFNNKFFINVGKKNSSMIEIKENFLGDILRNHIELIRIADSKARTLLIASSIVLTLSIGKIEQLSFLILSIFSLFTAFLSIIVIVPREHSADRINLMYYRSFLNVSEDEYVKLVVDTIKDKNKIIEEYARDIYSLGYKTLKKKYRYLNIAIYTFIAGFILSLFSVIIFELKP